MFQVFLNRCPVQVRPFPPNSRTSPLSASVEASVPREQVLRAQGAHARTHTHARLQLPLGFCVTCGCLTPPHPSARTLFEAVHGRRGAVHWHSPTQGPLTPSLSFLSSLLVFYCHPVSFPFLFFLLLLALDFSISQTVPPFLAQRSLFLSLPMSLCLSLTLVLMSDPSRQSAFSQCAVRLKDTAHWDSERNKLTGTMFSLSMLSLPKEKVRGTLGPQVEMPTRSFSGLVSHFPVFPSCVYAC